MPYSRITHVMSSLEIADMNDDALEIIGTASRHIWAVFTLSESTSGVWEHVELERKCDFGFYL